MKNPTSHPVRSVLFRVFVIVVVCVLVVSMAWIVLPSRKSTSLDRPLPSPNGHDDFVAAGRSLTERDFDSRTASIERLRGYVSSNTVALAQVRLGLTRSIRVPVGFTLDYTSRRVAEVASTKRLELLLLAECKVAEMDGRIDDAMSGSLDALRFGQESVRGGLLIDMLVGVACEQMALGDLRRLLGSLDPTQCHRAIQVIQDLDRAREPTAEFLAREQVWCRRVWGWRGALLRILPGNVQSQHRAEQKAASKRDQVDRQRGALLSQLASRAYRLETGNDPRAWDDLVPRHLERIPSDPDTGQPLPFDVATTD